MTSSADVIALLGSRAGVIAIDAPGAGAGFWAGAPSAVWLDGTFWLAYRIRHPVDQGRGVANVIARSDDGVRLTTVAVITSDQFQAASLERPALVPLADGGWRVYVSCSSWQSKHWWVESIDASAAERLPAGERHVVLAGDAASAWKDVVIRREDQLWQMWACRHPLDGGDDEADRMSSWYLTSADGLDWSAPTEALAPTARSWDARGTRITSVFSLDGQWLAFYDGRSSADENWHERTGAAIGLGPESFRAVGSPTPAGRAARYLSVVRQPAGVRLYWEAERADGAHELRTVYVPGAISACRRADPLTLDTPSG